MNEHIKPIFEIVIPRIQFANTKYWIYGGIGYAAMVGHCYRTSRNANGDVDLFVLKDDFETVENILGELCKENDWRVRKTFTNNRPKIDILVLKNKKRWVERMSVVPTHKKDGCVELKFRKGSGKYPLDILDRKKRHLDGFDFFTISDEFLKKLFIEYLNSKRRYPPKRIEDARHILSEEEFKIYLPDYSYGEI